VQGYYNLPFPDVRADEIIGKKSNSRIRVSSYRSTNTPAKTAGTPSRPWYAVRKRLRVPSAPGPISSGSSRSPRYSPPARATWRCVRLGPGTSVRGKNGCGRSGNTSSTTTTIDAVSVSSAVWPLLSPVRIMSRMDRVASGRRGELNEITRSGVIVGDAARSSVRAARGSAPASARPVRRHPIPNFNGPTAESEDQV
jgi:hypothetical protein